MGKHKDAFGVSSGRPMPLDKPEPPPGTVNTHPGPDLAPESSS